MSFELAKEKALRYIMMSKKTEQEVYNKLIKLGFEENIVLDVIDYLKSIKYIDDNDYVDAYIRQCMRLMNYSIYEIKNKLLQKGIEKCIIENKLEDLKESEYEEKLRNKLLSTKCKNMDEQKIKSYFYRRGLYIN